ncbi:putative hydrolase [Caenibius tardaugens NBRC 16725]|uniref:Putative hydrolase n=1 Tax=Caenibius tardaugens NBRC 16725 TaxID=1219035 RepID=U2YKT6_9SPHN|nr:cell wall hydrolase [Caenibius tardaugens]AZI36014.1 cell wall hydrolase [Caenibius tardaugens NBRC 16725]GAD48922.1 putative hydrolase [Caenibius tardaugens NBRC 16725]
MSRQTRVAGTFAVAALLITALFAAESSGAAAQDYTPGLLSEILPLTSSTATEATSEATQVVFTAKEVVQQLPAETSETPTTDDDGSHASLRELVAATDVDDTLSQNMRCLAAGIYFESKGEPLEGQLAVGHVIVNRATSGRFPSSYCGVLFQPSQFSFIRGGQMPAIRTGSAAWRTAKAIAQIAHEGSWKSPAQGALFFHARYVSPRWRLQRVAQVHNHVFYR